MEFDGGRIWAAIVDNPDVSVLGRTWVTEIVVGERADGVHFGTRLLNVTRGDHEPFEIGEALYMLDELFVLMKREPGALRREAFDSRLAELGLEDTPCFTQRNEILRFPEYAVTYRGERHWCDWHIKAGGGTDPRQLFRIYYCWHEEDQIVLIGHLPSHLQNNLTN